MPSLEWVLKRLKCGKDASEVGSDPVSEFPYSSKVLSAFKLPTCSGMVPVMAFLDTYKVCAWVKAPSSEGRVPVRELVCSHSAFKSVSKPSSVGKLPSKLLRVSLSFTTVLAKSSSRDSQVTPYHSASHGIPTIQFVFTVQSAPLVASYSLRNAR
jgi:hypothetical protein